jgi:predicted DNA-binding protein (MmcQ/YjbR family)
MGARDALARCEALPGAAAEFPFGPEAMVFKVGGRMFALFLGGRDAETVNLKCDPRFAEALRDEHPGAITPGYHMNKRHWNTVRLDADLPGELVADLVDHSYTLVVDGLPRRVRDALRPPAGQDATG